jgi:hypothetical protein
MTRSWHCGRLPFSERIHLLKNVISANCQQMMRLVSFKKNKQLPGGHFATESG